MQDDGKSAEDLIDDDSGDSSSNDSDSSNGGDKKDSAGSGSPKLYEFNGKQLTAEQLAEEAQKLQKDYTIKTQKLSELESQTGNQSDKDKGKTLSEKDQEVIKQLKEWGFTQKDDVQGIVKEEAPAIGRAASSTASLQIKIEQQLTEATKLFDGSEEKLPDGSTVKKPKVTEQEIFDFYKENPNTKLDVLQVGKFLHHDEFLNYEVRKKATGSKTNLPETEASSGGADESNSKKKAPSFGDGSVERNIAEKLGVKPRAPYGGV